MWFGMYAYFAYILFCIWYVCLFCISDPPPPSLFRTSIRFCVSLPKWLILIVSFRALYDKAMRKGYVETSVTKCLILGAAGVGKTHLRHLLLKRDPPELRVSTGLADNPVRAISFHRANVGEQEQDEWFVADDDQALKTFISSTVKDSVSMATSLDDVVSTLPKQCDYILVRAPDSAGAGHRIPPIHADNTNNETVQQTSTVAIEDELIHHINQYSGKDG